MNQLSYACQASSSLTSGIALVSSSATQLVSGKQQIQHRFRAWLHGRVHPYQRCWLWRGLWRDLSLLTAFPADFAQSQPNAPRWAPGDGQVPALLQTLLGHPYEKSCRVPLAPSLPGAAHRTTSSTLVCSSPYKDPSSALPKKPQHLFCTRNEAGKT